MWHFAQALPWLNSSLCRCRNREAGPCVPNYLLHPGSQSGCMSQFAGMFQHTEGEGHADATTRGYKLRTICPIRMKATLVAIGQ